MKRIMFIIGAMFLVLNIAFGFNMSTTVFDQRIDTGGYREIIFKNTSNMPIRYKFTVKDSGKKNDMSKWVKLYPKVMNIPPLKEGILKVYAQSPTGVENGEYYFVLQISPIAIPSIKEETGKIVGASNVSFVPLIVMKGYVGEQDFNKNLLLTDIKFKKNSKNKLEMSASIDNKCDIGLNLGLKFLNSSDVMIDGKVIGEIKKNKKGNFKITLDNIANEKEISKIVIYDAVNFKNLTTVSL